MADTRSLACLNPRAACTRRGSPRGSGLSRRPSAASGQRPPPAPSCPHSSRRPSWGSAGRRSAPCTSPKRALREIPYYRWLESLGLDPGFLSLEIETLNPQETGFCSLDKQHAARPTRGAPPPEPPVTATFLIFDLDLFSMCDFDVFQFWVKKSRSGSNLEVSCQTGSLYKKSPTGVGHVKMTNFTC